MPTSEFTRVPQIERDAWQVGELPLLPATRTPLCQYCRPLDPLLRLAVFQSQWQWTETWYPNETCIRKAAREGCAICGLLFDEHGSLVINFFSPDEGEVRVHANGQAISRTQQPLGSDSLCVGWEIGVDHIQFGLWCRDRSQVGRPRVINEECGRPMCWSPRLENWKRMPDGTCHGLEQPCRRLIRGHRQSIQCEGRWAEINLFQDPLCDQAIGMIRSWMTHCMSSHTACQGKGKQPLPTRVIDVMSEYPNVSLVETGGALGEYVTLTHRWGVPEPLKTTSISLKAHLEVIEWSQLNGNFQDAITVTRRLNIRYLWIDSLCIIQERRGVMEDYQAKRSRQEEIGKMCDIYSFALLNIDASASHGGKEGFLRPRQSSTCPRMVVQESASNEGIFVLPNILDGADEVELGVTSKRGWVLQERVLSPRILHFSFQEIIWECQEGLLFESSFRDPVTALGRKKEKDIDGTIKQLLFGPRSTGIYKRWHRLVENYSLRTLTKGEDKLPAISALADRFLESMNQDQYYAGLFKKDIIRGLQWCVSPRPVIWDNPGIRYRWRAPSWSWASLDGPVCYMEPEESFAHPRLAIISCEGFTLGRRPSDCAKSEGARLTLRGLAREFTSVVVLEQFLPPEHTFFDEGTTFKTGTHTFDRKLLRNGSLYITMLITCDRALILRSASNANGTNLLERIGFTDLERFPDKIKGHSIERTVAII